MSSAGKWMELEVIMLCKLIQTQKEKYPIFSLMENVDFFKRHESRRGAIWEKEGDQWEEVWGGTHRGMRG
jgi:hypothetical protein